MAKATSLESLRAVLVDNLVTAHHPRFINIIYSIGAFCVVLKVVQVVRRRFKTTDLRGPSNPSFVWGIGKVLLASPDVGAQYERWAEEYGGAYEVSSALGGRRIVLCDPKAIAHLFGGEPWTYTLTPVGKLFREKLVGKGILTATKEDHRRQRKTLTPAFSNASIRDLTSVFYDLAYKTKGIWDNQIESNGGDNVIIDVQSCMNKMSLDVIGIAGFSHDFGSLDGKPTSVTEILDAFSNDGGKASIARKLILQLAEALPWLLRLPTPCSKFVDKLNDSVSEISDMLLAKSRKEKEAGILEGEEKSILGLLISSERGELTREEVMAQAMTLLIAGFETTSRPFQWALIELSRNPHMQSKLRAELLEFKADPTFDQLSSNFPYLDAVVHETLRLHPPVHDFMRMAAEDDLIPLSKPIRTRADKLVDHISVAKGTYLFISAPSINRSTTLWGADAKEFKPERWIEEGGIPAGAKEVQGHRHLLTFMDGPRTCLGKGFAIAEFKIVLLVLVTRFVFEFRDGRETGIETSVEGLLPRPKLSSEEGTAVPLRVRRFQ